MFCFTETKVECIDSITKGIKLFTNHRTKKGEGRRISHRTFDRQQNKTRRGENRKLGHINYRRNNLQ